MQITALPRADLLQNSLFFQRQKRTQNPQCTMSLEPFCTGRWASFYPHLRKYRIFLNLVKRFQSIHHPRLIPLSFILPLCNSIYSSLSSFSSPLLCLLVFFSLSILTAFLFLCPFLCHSSHLSNFNLQFLDCLFSYSVSVASLLSLSTSDRNVLFPLMLFLFLLHCQCIFGGAQRALNWHRPNGSQKTCLELARKKKRKKERRSWSKSGGYKKSSVI